MRFRRVTLDRRLPVIDPPTIHYFERCLTILGEWWKRLPAGEREKWATLTRHLKERHEQLYRLKSALAQNRKDTMRSWIENAAAEIAAVLSHEFNVRLAEEGQLADEDGQYDTTEAQSRIAEIIAGHAPGIKIDKR